MQVAAGHPVPWALPVALAAAIGASVLLGGPVGAVAWVGGLGVLAVACTTGRPRAVIAVALLYSATFGAITAVPALAAIPLAGTIVSGGSLGTTLILVVAALTLLLRADRQLLSGLRPFAPFWILALLQGIGVLYSPTPVEGAKQAVLIAVPFVMAAVAHDAARSVPGSEAAVQGYVLASARILLVCLAAFAFTGALGITEVGLGSSIGSRSIAFYTLPVISLSLAMWRHGADHREQALGKWYALVLIALVVATLSRTATAIALGLLLPLRFIGAGWRRGMLALAAGSVLFLSAVLLIAPLGRRFFFLERPGSLGEVAVAEGINTMGRSTMWAITWTGALERPVFGHGAGAVRQLMQTTLELDHPHNDYLKILYDSGAVGLAALVVGCLMAIARHGRYWKHADERGDRESAKYHMTAFLAAISFAGSLLTDNVLVYTFVTVPTFVLMGISVARANEA
jgi:hypothetical protein